MNDLISVVVTCYNHENYIEQCLRSIFDQSYRHIELIVLDDGSTDASDEIIKQVLEDSPFETRYETHPNMGVVGNRNLGLDYLTGDYFIFVDSDNYLDQTHIELCYEKMIEQEADIVYGDLYNPDVSDYHLTSQNFELSSFLRDNYIDNCALVRTSILGPVRYDNDLNYQKLEDYDFFLNLVINQGAKPVYQPKVRLNYRVFETGSISGRDSERYHFEIYLKVLEKYLDKLPHAIYRAVSEKLLTIEDRLDDLTNHHGNVSDYLLNLEKDNNKLKIQHDRQSKHLREAREEIESIRQSLSYRLGNALINPVKVAGVIVKNPRTLWTYAGLLKGKVIRLRRKLPSPKVAYCRFRRNKEREQLERGNRRALVYVIFESEKRLQTYKILFLEALAKLSEDVLIVVNGKLDQKDLAHLEQYGQVVFRENKGYDTAAFREGIFTLGQDKLKGYDQLLLVNDTNIGPMRDLNPIFEEMSQRKLDFWGISFGEEQEDVTQENPYGYIPKHLQSYFMVIEKLLLQDPEFYIYWQQLTDTDSREKAIGKHETRFTKHFADLGYRYDALVQEDEDSAMYIHPLKMLKAGSPLVKYTALRNFDEEQFLWQGVERDTEVPDLLDYVRTSTDYPISILEDIVDKFKNLPQNQYVLMIDGVENIIPQCTRYRVLNKAEQLQKHGIPVKVVNASEFQLAMAQYASHIIIYRAPISPVLMQLCQLAKDFGKTVFFDIDDLVFDTIYTDQLSYTQGLSEVDKGHYDASVRNYGLMLEHCDAAITSTNQLQTELLKYKDKVLLNRNLASDELIALSRQSIKTYHQTDETVKIGYFSGSISHNENFELVKPALKTLFDKYDQVELHIVGHLDIPTDLTAYQERIIRHDYVDWDKLPTLISQVDINLAPLVDSIFNRAKSEIKWMEAALVKVPTVASDLGAFADMVIDGETGLLAKNDQWFDKLESLVLSSQLRQTIAENAYQAVMTDCTLDKKDEMVAYFEQN